ncbi:MAG TPA: carotenoid biosynthesis protein [Ktedonobacteraceae bacterium]
MKFVKFLFICHLIALALALCGLLLLLPRAGFWGSDPARMEAWQVLLRVVGALQILFGAATMLFFGWLYVGPRKTLVFFVTSLFVSFLPGFLLMGKTALLGVFTPEISSAFSEGAPGVFFILLSWFYMSFTSYLLACKLVARLGLSWQTFWSLLLGTYFLIAWAAALNGALASVRLPVQTSIWHVYGSAFGLPVYNVLNWIIAGLILLSLIQLLWRDRLNAQSLVIDLPFGVYTANIGFVMILSFGAGLWFPLFLSALFVLAPETLALYPREDASPEPPGRARALTSQVIWLFLRVATLGLFRRQVRVSAEGVEYIPRSGAVVIAARHFHFLYDGYTLVRVVPRRLHTVVALDWLQIQSLRLLIELACGLADWPVLLRGSEMKRRSAHGRWVYQPVEGRRYLRQVMQAVIRLLRAGEVLVIFPEGYPNIDPHPTPKQDLESFLPFQAGFVKMVERAQKDGHTRVAIVPAGLAYSSLRGKAWRVHARFGPALYLEDFASGEQALRTVEERVQALSAATHSLSELPE